MQKKKRHRMDDLPYTPSEDFLRESRKLLREKGVKDSDSGLDTQIIKAYRVKRAEILAKEAMSLYGD